MTFKKIVVFDQFLLNVISLFLLIVVNSKNAKICGFGGIHNFCGLTDL